MTAPCRACAQPTVLCLACTKTIGRSAVPWIVLLVAIGVTASYFLPAAALPAVIGLVSTAVMALIAMVTGITGTREKEDRPEFAVINDLIKRLNQKDPPVQVTVDVPDPAPTSAELASAEAPP